MRLTPLAIALVLAASVAEAANMGDVYQQARRNDAIYAAAYAAYKAGLEKLPITLPSGETYHATAAIAIVRAAPEPST